MPISPSTMSLIVMRSFHKKQALAKNKALPVMPEIRDCGSKLAEIPVSNLNLLRTVSGYSKRRRRATVQLMEKTMRSLLSITAVAIAFALRCMRVAEADLNYTGFSGEQSAKQTSRKIEGGNPSRREARPEAAIRTPRAESGCSRKIVPTAPATARPTASIMEKLGCFRFTLREWRIPPAKQRA